jgi:hypothetical protein
MKKNISLVTLVLLVITSLVSGCAPASTPSIEPSSEDEKTTPTDEPTKEPTPTPKKEKTFKLMAECVDWGEVISAIEVDFGESVVKEDYKPEDFEIKTTVTYFSYQTNSNVTEDVVRNVTNITAEGAKLRLELELPQLSQTIAVYSDSVEAHTLTVKGEECKCIGLVSPWWMLSWKAILVTPTIAYLLQSRMNQLHWYYGYMEQAKWAPIIGSLYRQTL